MQYIKASDFRTQKSHSALADHPGDVRENAGNAIAGSAIEFRLNCDLAWAVQSDDVEQVRQMILAGADVETRDDTGVRTPLGVAATNGNLTIVEVLLEAGAKINPSDDDSSVIEPLWFATANRHAETAKRLIEAGATLGGPNGRNMFLPAIVSGEPRLVALFLDAGADPNAEFRGWLNPLSLALALGQKEIVDLLIAAGAKQADTTGT